MPLWLINIGLWIKGNPIQALQMMAVMALIGLATFWYFDYTGTKRENADLKAKVGQIEADYKAATTRIDEFVVAQEKFESDLEKLRQSSIQIRGQVRDALKGLKAAEIEDDFTDDPSGAEAALNRRIAALFGMFERVTGPSAGPGVARPSPTRPD